MALSYTMCWCTVLVRLQDPALPCCSCSCCQGTILPAVAEVFSAAAPAGRGVEAVYYCKADTVGHTGEVFDNTDCSPCQSRHAVKDSHSHQQS
jgi:hypothetical protein